MEMLALQQHLPEILLLPWTKANVCLKQSEKQSTFPLKNVCKKIFLFEMRTFGARKFSTGPLPFKRHRQKAALIDSSPSLRCKAKRWCAEATLFQAATTRGLIFLTSRCIAVLRGDMKIKSRPSHFILSMRVGLNLRGKFLVFRVAIIAGTVYCYHENSY